MQKRSYNQACSLAVALDLIGERWTWLVLRGLLTGPKRYGELVEQLPGIGSNLLSARLKHLVATGIAEKEGRGRQTAYRLTQAGEALRPITHELIRWGRQFPLKAAGTITSMPEWDMLAVEAAYNPPAAGSAEAIIQLTLSNFTFHLVIRKGRCRAISGPASHGDLNIVSDSATLQSIGSGRLNTAAAIQSGKLLLTGDTDLFTEFLDWFSTEATSAGPVSSAV